MVKMHSQRHFSNALRHFGGIQFIALLMVLIWQVDGTVGETPYHYISQVAETTPQILSPKPLFSPHDVRREGNGRKGLYDNGRIPVYGTKQLGEAGGTSGHNLVYTDTASNINGQEQAFWYPVYSDVQYPGWVSLSESPYVLSYGALPEGYEPVIPLRGDPTGYSFSYQAGDHSRQETSDGRGNFYSSFSFIPPADHYGQQPSGALPSHDYNVFSTIQPPTVNIPARRPTVHSTVSPTFPTRKPPTLKPLFRPSQSPRPYDTPTARPLVGSNSDPNYNDFINGFQFESKKLFTTKIPQTPFTASSHALSTNIQYNNLARETSSKSSLEPSGLRSVTIEPHVPTSSTQVSTDRSYQTLSRSLPLAFASQRFSTIATPSESYLSTEKPYSTKISRFVNESRSRPEVEFRSASRRSTTERVESYSALQQSTTPNPPSSSTKPSVIQKIPRKLNRKNVTAQVEPAPRPFFIDDLTSLAYSADKINPMNNTIIQFKSRNSKIHPDSSEKTAVHNKYSLETDHLKNSSMTSDISKDGYITGNKTYLGGLGLRTNIHY